MSKTSKAFPKEKTCTKCETSKPLTEFRFQKTGKYQRRAQCKACLTAYDKQYRELQKSGPSTEEIMKATINSMRDAIDDQEEIDRLIIKLQEHNNKRKVEKLCTNKNSFRINIGTGVSKEYETGIKNVQSDNDLIFQQRMFKDRIATKIRELFDKNIYHDHVQFTVNKNDYLVYIEELELSAEQMSNLLEEFA